MTLNNNVVVVAICDVITAENTTLDIVMLGLPDD